MTVEGMTPQRLAGWRGSWGLSQRQPFQPPVGAPGLEFFEEFQRARAVHFGEEAGAVPRSAFRVVVAGGAFHVEALAHAGEAADLLNVRRLGLGGRLQNP